MLKKNLPNIITSLRIILTVCLLFTKPFTVSFFVIYTSSGFTDILDGTIARITKTTSEFGAKLDSAADLLFYSIMIIKIFPKLLKILPLWVWCFAVLIALERVFSYTYAAIKYKCFASLHTLLNKITGFAVFVLPYIVNLCFGVYYCIIVCIVGLTSTTEELIIHIKGNKYEQA